MSQDVFQIQMDRILEQCAGVIGIHDDVIIYGYTWEDYDANLINFLNVCQMEGLCLSSKKLELCRDRVSFIGAIYSREGVEPDPRKIQGIEEMTAPETKQQLESFLGMVTYMGNFIPYLTLSLLHFFCYLHLVLSCMDGGLIHLVIGKLSFKIKSFCFL